MQERYICHIRRKTCSSWRLEITHSKKMQRSPNMVRNLLFFVQTFPYHMLLWNQCSGSGCVGSLPIFWGSRIRTGSVIISMDTDSSIKNKIKSDFYCFVTLQFHVIFGAVLWMASFWCRFGSGSEFQSWGSGLASKKCRSSCGSCPSLTHVGKSEFLILLLVTALPIYTDLFF